MELPLRPSARFFFKIMKENNETPMTREQLAVRQKKEREEFTRMEKERKAAEREAEKERKAAERAAEQERKRADRLADRERRYTENVLAALGRLGYECDDDGGYDDHGYAFDENGNLERTSKNIQTLFAEHPEHAGKFGFNKFTATNEYDGKPLDEKLYRHLYARVEEQLGYIDIQKVLTAVSEVCDANKYNPVLDRVDELVWDGKPRVETFFIDRLGAPDTPLTREMSFKWLFATLKRVKEPACTFDHYLIISDSKQGTGKSKCFTKLTEWLGSGYTATNITTDLSSKDNIMAINSCIIGLFDETDQMKYAKLESFKKFVTETCHKVRIPYEKGIVNLPVHCTFAATTNDSEFLTDSTSGYERRAWVLLCDGVWRSPDEWEKLNGEEVIKQVWAELNYYYKDEKNREYAPWDIRGSNVSYLTKENEEALKQIQLGVKTSTNDTSANIAIETVLNQKYSLCTSDSRKGDVFKTPVEFMEDQKNSAWNDNALVYQLEKIPFTWFVGYVNKLIGPKGNRSEVYIRSIIEGGELVNTVGEWEIGFRSYDGKKQKCIYRKSAGADGSVPDETAAEPKPEPVGKPSVRPKTLLEQAEEMVADPNALPDAEHSPMMEKIRKIQRGEIVLETPAAARPAPAKPKRPKDTQTRGWTMDDVVWDELDL